MLIAYLKNKDGSWGLIGVEQYVGSEEKNWKDHEDRIEKRMLKIVGNGVAEEGAWRIIRLGQIKKG